MKQSKINFTVALDDDNIPEKITWEATEKGTDHPEETKSISISLWDHQQQNTMRIDLWTKEMPVDEMKRFYIDCLGGLAQSVQNSTGDEFMSKQMNDLCEKLVEHVKKENQG
ncbi:MAG TPA: gliding motility protein GldC [Fulvivirga sp.]|nr:gliding motility protein GldC [Fulvivirga sp.]